MAKKKSGKNWSSNKTIVTIVIALVVLFVLAFAYQSSREVSEEEGLGTFYFVYNFFTTDDENGGDKEGLGQPIRECTSDKDCKDIEISRLLELAFPYCDTSKWKCVRCLGDPGCTYEEDRICILNNFRNQCVQCIEDKDCNFKEDYNKCFENKCVECLSSFDCKSYYDEEYLDPFSGKKGIVRNMYCEIYSEDQNLNSCVECIITEVEENEDTGKRTVISFNGCESGEICFVQIGGFFEVGLGGECIEVQKLFPGVPLEIT